MAQQLYVNAANAATNIMSQLCKDIRASDLPKSTQHAMCEDIGDLAALVEELERLATMEAQPVRGFLRLVRS